MADTNRTLDSIVNIDGDLYEVVAEMAKKVETALTITVKKDENPDNDKKYTYDGSSDPEITIQAIGEASHAATADVAKQTQATLTITTIVDGNETEIDFNGSEGKEITIGDANKIKVTMDDGTPAYAAITISKNEPTGGNTGDIWFKYIN